MGNLRNRIGLVVDLLPENHKEICLYDCLWLVTLLLKSQKGEQDSLF